MFRTFVLTSLVALASAAQAQTVQVMVPTNGAGSLSERIADAAETACGPLARTSNGILLVNASTTHALCVRAAIRSAHVSPSHAAMIANK